MVVVAIVQSLKKFSAIYHTSPLLIMTKSQEILKRSHRLRKEGMEHSHHVQCRDPSWYVTMNATYTASFISTVATLDLCSILLLRRLEHPRYDS